MGYQSTRGAKRKVNGCFAAAFIEFPIFPPRLGGKTEIRGNSDPRKFLAIHRRIPRARTYPGGGKRSGRPTLEYRKAKGIR